MAEIVPFPKTDQDLVENFRLRVGEYHGNKMTADQLVHLTDQDLGILDNGGDWG